MIIDYNDTEIDDMSLIKEKLELVGYSRSNKIPSCIEG